MNYIFDLNDVLYNIKPQFSNNNNKILFKLAFIVK